MTHPLRMGWRRWQFAYARHRMSESIVAGMGPTGGRRNTDALKASKVKLGCSFLSTFMHGYANRMVARAWRVLVEALSVHRVNREIEREYVYLEGIMNSFSRLQDRHGGV